MLSVAELQSETPVRLIEDAVDEIARLDQTCALEVPAVSSACWFFTVAATFAPPASRAIRPVLDTLVAASADPVHDAALEGTLLRLRDFAAVEQRRQRSGTPLSLARLEPFTLGLATYPDRDQLEAIWAAGTRDRSVLMQAIAAAAWLDDPRLEAGPVDIGGLAIALLLCGTGRTAHLRFAPLVGLPREARSEATRAWREARDSRFATLALDGIARGARRTREAVAALAAARGRDERALETLGRAGINARRTLAHLHASLATTMPLTAETLDLSRPAATAALERLVSLGVAKELTGRARDRVFAWEAPLSALATTFGAAGGM